MKLAPVTLENAHAGLRPFEPGRDGPELHALAARARYLLEPVGRNTAPAVSLAALQALQDGADPVLVVTPADQTVTDQPGHDQQV